MTRLSFEEANFRGRAKPLPIAMSTSLTLGSKMAQLWSIAAQRRSFPTERSEYDECEAATKASTRASQLPLSDP